MTENPTTEHDVRQMLQRRAGDVAPSPDAWAEIESRLGGDGDARVVPLVPRRDRRMPGLLVAAAVLVALGLAALVVAQPDGSRRIRSGPAAPGGSLPPKTTQRPGPVGVPAAPPPIWPATTDSGLAASQSEADAGRRPDLLDPQTSARQYLTERLQAPAGPRADFEPQEFVPNDAQSGLVPFTVGDTPGSVVVRRNAGEGSIWYVVALIHVRIPVLNPRYDGTRFTAEVRPGIAGRLDVEVSGSASADRAAQSGRSVNAGESVSLDVPFTDPATAIAQIRLTSPEGGVTLAEVRADVASEVRVPQRIAQDYCVLVARPFGGPYTEERRLGTDAHGIYLRLLIDDAPAEVRADLEAYRDYIVDNVDPDEPASQKRAGWPATIREVEDRISRHDAQRCRDLP